MTPEDHASARPTDRKATLFCPDCGHEAPLDGDWSHDDHEDDDRDGDRRSDVSCPDCGQLVVSQPRFAALDGGETGGSVRPILQLLNAVVRHDVL